MTTTTMRELREKTDAELRTEAARLRAEVREHRFGMATSQRRDVHARTVARRTVARIMTELAARAAKA